MLLGPFAGWLSVCLLQVLFIPLSLYKVTHGPG
jgi:hypothetical protein